MSFFLIRCVTTWDSLETPKMDMFKSKAYPKSISKLILEFYSYVCCERSIHLTKDWYTKSDPQFPDVEKIGMFNNKSACILHVASRNWAWWYAKGHRVGVQFMHMLALPLFWNGFHESWLRASPGYSTKLVWLDSNWSDSFTSTVVVPSFVFRQSHQSQQSALASSETIRCSCFK